MIITRCSRPSRLLLPRRARRLVASWRRRCKDLGLFFENDGLLLASAEIVVPLCSCILSSCCDGVRNACLLLSNASQNQPPRFSIRVPPTAPNHPAEFLGLLCRHCSHYLLHPFPTLLARELQWVSSSLIKVDIHVQKASVVQRSKREL